LQPNSIALQARFFALLAEYCLEKYLKLLRETKKPAAGGGAAGFRKI
jgi:hypothetical protein